MREVILRIERSFEARLAELQREVAHLPSRVRSLLWILAAVPVLAAHGLPIADEQEVLAALAARLPCARALAPRRAPLQAIAVCP